MENLIRFGVSVESDLLEEFDKYWEETGFSSRSDALRSMMRDKLSRERWTSSGGEICATISIVYDHTEMGAGTEVVEAQHQYTNCLISTMHIHLDEKNCLEIMALKGTVEEIREAAKHIIPKRGVKQGKLSVLMTE